MKTIQSCELVDRRWQALLDGLKLDTIRFNEGDFSTGFLVYYNSSKTQKTVVWVKEVSKIQLRNIGRKIGFDAHRPDNEAMLAIMRRHYPEITLDTVVTLVEHLSVEKTARLYPNETSKILRFFKIPNC